MVAIVALLVFLAVCLLALRYGYDSRDGFRSKEEELARLGVSWDDLADPQFIPFFARERRQQLLAEGRKATLAGQAASGSVRAALARRLYALADRVDAGAVEARAARVQRDGSAA
jgi:hypothetical protein